MGVGAGLYMYDVVVKSSRSLSHLLVSSCTFRVRRRRGEMYIGHGRLCVSLSVAFLHYCMDPDVTAHFLASG